MVEEAKQEDAHQNRLEDMLGDDERPVLSEFSASVLQPNNFSGVIALPLAGTPVVLASLTDAYALSLDEGDRVWLAGTVGWTAVTNGTGVSKVDVIFRIFRNTPLAGPQVFTVRESAEPGFDNFKTTSFIHVDIDPVSNGATLVSYFLTAELPLSGSAATVIGPITFTAADLEPNHKVHGYV
jgi:hypothetical protein